VTTPSEPEHLDFYFDVLCPFAWRTSLWMREVIRECGVDVTWKQFSLAIANAADPRSEYMQRDLALGRTFIAAERLGGNDGVDRLYLALGDAIHGQRLNPLDEAVMKDILVSAGHIPELMEAALNDDTTEDEYRASHADGLAAGAFGVPTLVFDGSTRGTFGPVIDPVPTGEDAVELWRVMRWVGTQPFMWELKKDRAGTRLGPLRAPGLLLDAAAAAQNDDGVDACAWVPTQSAAG
jgi:predicted DsbA family dithiol-disulfide isomerase